MTDLYPQPLIGYKELVCYDGKLTSPQRNTLWSRAEQVATCSLHDEVPHEKHGCGLWALWEPDRHVLKRTHQSDRGRIVLALVWGYGNWYANELSWRAEKQKLAALCSDGSCENVELLGAVLGVTAMPLEQMQEYAEYAGMKLGGEDG